MAKPKKDYKCSICEQVFERENLIAKRVRFTDISTEANVYKNRTVGWLCQECLQKDEAWNIEPYSTVRRPT